MVEVADGSIYAHAIAEIRLLMLTGYRRSKIISLRWDDVDWAVGELRLSVRPGTL